MMRVTIVEGSEAGNPPACFCPPLLREAAAACKQRRKLERLLIVRFAIQTLFACRNCGDKDSWGFISMEPRSLRVGPDGVIHSALRNQLAANPLHNLSYAQNVGYALPGFKPALASSESAGHDSILKGWQYLSPHGVTSLNVSNAGSSAVHAASAPAFPGLNHRTSSDVASAVDALGRFRQQWPA